jgi:hypothetical protein
MNTVNDVPDPIAGGFDAFVRAAQLGKMRKSNGEPPVVTVGSGETPLSLGASSGYLMHDIAHFYLARQMVRRRLDDASAIRWRAYVEFMFDAIYEGVEIPEQVAASLGVLTACQHAPVRPLRTAGPAGTVRVLCFADTETAHAWIQSMNESARRAMQVVESTCMHGSRCWVQSPPGRG